MSGKWALRNPAVKRIMQELREMEKEDSPDILAEAIEVRGGPGPPWTVFCTPAACRQGGSAAKGPHWNPSLQPLARSPVRRRTSSSGTL